MKLVFAIINHDDANTVTKSLTKNGFSSTKLATTGGFLMAGNVTADLARRRVALDALGSRRCLQDPLAPLESRRADLLQTEQRLHDAIPRALERRREDVSGAAARLAAAGPRLLRPAESTLARLAASLEALSPLSVLSRGYAIARDAAGHVVKDASGLSAGDEVRVLLGTGSFDASVTATHTTSD